MMRRDRAMPCMALVCLALSLIRAQTPQAQTASVLNPGVIVEKIAKYSEAEKAGLAEGDVILRWSRDDTSGEIQSPFDLASIEIEQAPRGKVSLEGRSGSNKKAWSLGQDTWGIQVQPNFPEALLTIYRAGEELAAAGKLDEASDKWREIADQIKSSDPTWLRSWLIFHIAQLKAEAKQWKEADQAFQQSTELAGAGPEARAQVQRAWGGTFLPRSDWVDADEHFRQAMTVQPDLDNEHLAGAIDLDNLGNLELKRGDLAKASDFYRQALRMREKLAPGSLSVATSLNHLGFVADLKSELAQAEEFDRRALSISEKLAPGSLAVAEALGNLGDAIYDRGDLVSAEEYYTKSSEICAKLAPDSLEQAMALNRLGWAANARGNPANAEEYHRHALAIREKLAPGGIEVALSLHNLGNLAQDRGDLAKTEEYRRQELEIRERLAPGSLDVASSLASLGLLAHTRGDLARAEEYYARALAIRQKLAPGSLDVAASLSSLGGVADDRSDLAKAEDYYRQALAIREKLAPGSLDVAGSLSSLGGIADERGDLAKAEDYYRQALAIREKLAPGGLDVAGSLSSLGGIAEEQGDVTKAEDYFHQALAIHENLAPGGLDVAASLSNLGGVATDRGDLAKAEEYYAQALAIRQKFAPGSLAIAASLSNLGVVAWRRGELAKAEEYDLQALAIRQQLAPGGLDVGASLNDLGLVAWQRGDLAKAQKYYLQSLEIKQRLAPGSLATAHAFNNLGLVEWDRGNLTEADTYMLQALAIRQRLAPESLIVATTLNNLGVFAWQRGDLSKAENYQMEALAIRQKLATGSLDIAMSMDNLMLIALESGDLSKAEEYSQRSFTIHQKLAPNSLQVARSLENLGLVAHQRGDLAKAEDYFQKAVSIREGLAPMSVDLARNLNRLGGVIRDRGDLAKAEECYRRAFAVWEKLAPGSNNQAESLAALASIAVQRGQFTEAGSLYQGALDALDKQTTRLGGTEDVRAGFRAKYENYYQEYASLLVQQGKTDVAFTVMERSRARTLLEMLAAGHVDIHRGVDPKLLQGERSLQQGIIAKSDRRIRLLGDKHTEEQTLDIDKEIADLRDQYQTVESRIRAGNPGYAALTQPQPLTAVQVQQLLDANTVLLEYSLGEQRSHVFAVTADSIAARELPPRLEVERLARNVYDALISRNRAVKGEALLERQARIAKADRDYWSLSQQLSRMLLGPVAGHIAGKRLLVVSDGALQYIPFAALPDPANASAPPTPLAMGHEVVNLPSASVLAVLRQQERERKPAPKTVAVLADPVFSARDGRIPSKSRVDPSEAKRASSAPDSTARSLSVPNTDADDMLTRSVRDVGLLELSRLPFSSREAEDIMALTRPGQGMEALGFRANRATATNPELAQFRIIHFATHGLLDSQHPALSGLVLSLIDKQGKPQNGFLSLEDIYNLNLPADLVVLSACETGLGKEINGEGLIGLTRGFMYAGANRVVASLWSVNDAATAELMAKFYQGVLRDKLPPVAALRQAQASMWKRGRWKSPYYWAAFQIQGEWK